MSLKLLNIVMAAATAITKRDITKQIFLVCEYKKKIIFPYDFSQLSMDDSSKNGNKFIEIIE